MDDDAPLDPVVMVVGGAMVALALSLIVAAVWWVAASVMDF
jgi:Na+-transporting methylmalonyl-CoA/oxaloacetate decarboxylase gamma subunit